MPKLYEPKISQNPAHHNSLGNAPMDPSILDQFDPQMLAQMTQAFQKLPKGQLQKMQSLMQRAMSGKDITQEAQEFERSLPPDFQTLMQGFAQASGGLPTENPVPPPAAASPPTMSEEEARALIQQAAAQGQISQAEAQQLLQPSTEIPDEQKNPSSPETSSKFNRIWQSISGRKPS